MTTSSWATRVRHDSDATFREWGSEFASRLGTIGLVQTADTGQINWATVLRPGTSTNAGYEIWRFDDALQSTAPIFVRFDYGTHGSAAAPRIMVTVGTGTNGAGVITGVAATVARTISANTTQTGDTARQSYFCYKDGHLCLAWKTTAGGAEGLLVVTRTVDAAGAFTATGAMVVWGNSTHLNVNGTQALRFAASATAFTAQTVGAPNTALCLNPQAPIASVMGADTQAFVAFTITPRVEPLVGVCGVLDAEAGPGSTFTATLVGTTPRTYLALPDRLGPAGPLATNVAGGIKFATIWE